MNQHILAQLREEYPDLDEWVGELWLQWEAVQEARRRRRSRAGRWEALKVECERIRRETRNEGRTRGLIYRETMDDFEG